MKTVTTIRHSPDDILEVRSIWDEAEANRLLGTHKWVIMHAGLAHQDGHGFVAKPCYVLARLKEECR